MTLIRAALLSSVLMLPVGAASAQDAETLADIRQELSIVFVEIQRLKQELNTTGTAGTVGAGNTALERLSSIETELQRLTSKTEQLEFRIGSVVKDGTNRIGDLEFRLCELEPNCDLGSLGDTPLLGGGSATPATTPAAAPSSPTSIGGVDTSGLAVNEASDFRRAQEALSSGDFRSAADQFATFNQTYPGGPLASEAHFLRGQALEEAGDTREAARSYLEAFSGNPDGPRAPDALFKLGTSLGALGQTNEACVTLGEVAVRYPSSPAVADANGAMANLGCS